MQNKSFTFAVSLHETNYELRKHCVRSPKKMHFALKPGPYSSATLFIIIINRFGFDIISNVFSHDV